MQALLLASGEAEGLDALANQTPTPMLPVVNRPIMAYAVELLSRAKIRHQIVCLHDGRGAVEGFFGDGMRWGAKLDYVLLRERVGSAGALLRAASLISETFLALPAAALVDLDVEAALAFHQAHGGLATIITARDTAGAIRPTGAFIAEPAALAAIPAGARGDFVAEVAPALRASGAAIHEYQMDGYWNALESPAAYAAAQRAVMLSAWGEAAPSVELAGPRPRTANIEGRQIAPGIWVGRGDAIHPAVRLTPPVCIGARCRVGRDAEIGPFAVLGDGSIVDDEATVNESVVLPQTYVGRLVDIRRRVVSQGTMLDVESGERVEIADPFLLGAATAEGAVWTPIRLLDITLALLGLLVMLPLLLAVAVLALVSSRGRVLRREPRVGGYRRSSGGPIPELHHFGMICFAVRRPDGSVGALGRLLERHELHRTPALLNVLLGDLALVGIKPLTPEEAAQATEPWQKQRYECRAGLSGLWYVQGDRASSLTDVLVADAYYVATRSWRSDLKLLLRTPAAWLRRTVRPTDILPDAEVSAVY